MRTPHVVLSITRWAQVATATLLVAGCPVAIVWWLRASDTISSVVLCAVLGMGLSLSASHLGCALWTKRRGSEDLLFSELMIWGFLHRLRTQRRLASALDMLGPIGEAQQRSPNGLSTKQQAKLLEQLVAAMETRDPYLHGHSRRVARHSWMIARRMGLSRADVARIRTAAAIHDVGKIETPKAILHKRGPLSDDEYELIKRHPVDGAAAAAVLRDAELISIIRHHHERLDGTGYPSALTGEEIPLGARIIAVADTFDAITSERPYRAARSHKAAIDILRNESGIRLDPVAVRAFCSHYAGRRPLALWASVAGIPERLVSWLGGSVATVASTAKVLAITALVGSAAATSTLALPVAKLHPAKPSSRSTAALQAQAVNSTPGRVSALTATAPTPRGRRVGGIRRAVAKTSVRAGSPTSRLAASRSSGAAGAQPSPSLAAGRSSGQGTESGSGATPKTEERPGKGNGEERHGKSAETPGKIADAPGKSGEAPAKSGEAPGHSGEAPGKGGETPGKSGEPHGKVEEVVGKGGETPGKSGEPHGKVEEVVGKAKEVLGKVK